MAKTPLTLVANVTGTGVTTVFTVPSGHMYRVRRICLLNTNASNQGADVLLGSIFVWVSSNALVSGVPVNLWMLRATPATNTLTVQPAVGSTVVVTVDVDDYALG